MNYSKTLGDLGDRVDLLISRGDHFGPHSLALANPDGSPVDLTGCTLAGVVRVGEAEVAVRVQVTNPTQGQANFWLTQADTATLPAGATETAQQGAGKWQLKLTDSAGHRHPVFYGAAQVAPSLL